MGYIFGGNTGETAESLARKRAYAEALMNASGRQSAQNIPQGLNQLAQAAFGGLMQSQIAGKEADASAEYGKALGALMGVPDTGGPAPEPTFGQKLGNFLSGKGWGGDQPSPSIPQGNNIGSSSQDAMRASAGISGTEANAGDAKQAFLEKLGPAALQAAQQTGLDPRLILAQSAIETGWGKSAPGNNYFGIKSHGQAGGNTLATTEFVNGKPVTVQDAFRGYASPDESVSDYASFLQANPRYKPVLSAQGLEAQAAALGQSGYATDPNYGQKVLQVAQGIQLPGMMPSDPTSQEAAARVANAQAAFPDFTGQQPPQAQPSLPPQALAMQPAAQPQPAPPQMPQRPVSTAGLNYDPATGAIGPAANLGKGATLAPAAIEAMLGPQGAQAYNAQNPQQMPFQPQGMAPAPSMPQGGAMPSGGQPSANQPQQQSNALPGMNFDMAQAMKVLSNPYLDPSAKAQLAQIIQYRMQQAQQNSDPMRLLQIEKLQKDLNAPNLINAGDGRLYNPATGQWITAPAGSGGNGEYGLNPQYGVDANGNPVILQLNKAGEATTTKLPEGVKLSKEPIKLDVGTEFVLLDPVTRQPIGRIAKDVTGEASATAQGKAQGEAVAALPQVEQAASNMLATIDSLASDPYLGKMLGPIDSRLPNISENAARVQSKIDQLTGQSFLQAYNTLRGGGQITEVEGQKATQAMARLNEAQSEADYKSALNDLREVVQAGVMRAREKAGSAQPQPGVMPNQQRGTMGLGQSFPGGAANNQSVDDLLKKYGAK